MSDKRYSLVIGATGQVGRQICSQLGLAACLPTTRYPSFNDGGISLDMAAISNIRDVESLLGKYSLSAVYCVGGMTNVDQCEDEEELAVRTNCIGPGILADFSARQNIPFVYFSTEYVFDGVDGPYDENSKVKPLCAYGRSKLLGELAVSSACRHALILRTTVVYGPDINEKNFLYTLRRVIESGKLLRVPEDQISTPTYNKDLAAAAIGLMNAGAQGVYHVCGPDRISRLDFSRQVSDLWNLDASRICGVPTKALNQKAERPLNAGLLTTKLHNQYPSLNMRGVREALEDWGVENNEITGRKGRNISE